MPQNIELSKWRIVVLIIALSGVSFLSSFSTGIVTVELPQTASDLKLSEDLLLWPPSVYALACGSTLLLAGSVADVVGNRLVFLNGCFLVGCFIIACGLASTGIQLIVFRAMQGVAVSLCFPTSVAIVAHNIPSGQKRNIGFSCLGFVQPFGFSAGLVLGGVFIETVGWRFGFYLCGGLTLLLFLVSLWALPSDGRGDGWSSRLERLKKEIDWIGALVACTALALFSYVLAELTGDLASIKSPVNIALLAVSVVFVPVFIIWEHRQERLQRPAMIPNSLWKNTTFTNVCLMVMFSNAVVNGMESFTNLFFQQVQLLSPLESSIRIVPSLVVGVMAQLSIGILIHRLSPYWLVLSSLVLNAGAPLLMAIINPKWPYWYNAFFAQLLAPLSADVLFTIGLLVVSDVFPARTQALAGAVFNTVAQFGSSIGLAIMAVISSSVTKTSDIPDKSSPEALMVGYRAGFWAAFAWMGLAVILGVFGLRKMGKIGQKRD